MELTKEYLKQYFKHENLINRDLSWVDFNNRVMEEAKNPNLPLLDRIKFISIFFSNLDEFYMVRVSGIKEQIRGNVIEPTIDGLSPLDELKYIEQRVKPVVDDLVHYWTNAVIPELIQNEIHICNYSDFNEEEKRILDGYFDNQIYPVLTPLAFDPGRPFPYISNLSLSYAIQIKKASGQKHFARVKIPSILPRLLNIGDLIDGNYSKNTFKYIWIGDLIHANLDKLFPGVEIAEAHRFRITRDTDLEIQEDEADDLLELIEENIKQRRFGFVVRLEVEKSMPGFMIDTLTENLEITSDDIHVIDGPLGLSSVMELYKIPNHTLKEKPYHPSVPSVFDESENIFNIIRKRDLFVHHPYDSFNPVIDFIKSASQDPDVLAIKQTLYRVGQNSPVVKALIEAADRKKQVAVLVELKARFDEENNIYWARELEKAGVHVVYGLVGLKTHSKMTLVVRRESDGVKRYAHLGTGNYNPSTAKLYTDAGMFTANEEICSDVSEVFNYLTGYSEKKKYRKLFVAPIAMRQNILDLIANEIENVKNRGEGYLIFKMNSLVDPYCIAALYEASKNGVKVDLIIRGICCLVPGVPGLSENINVISIVGRFLEHSRFYYFYNNGSEDLYSGSADLMPRNLDRRVEVVFPIESEEIKRIVIDSYLKMSLRDNVKARVLQPDGKFVFKQPQEGEEIINVQEWLMEHNEENQLKKSKAVVPRI